MFTGLVEGAGRLVRVRAKGPDTELVIQPPWPAGETVVGESVCVNGACLTATSVEKGDFKADVSAETLERTTLGRLGPGAEVNLERALKLGDRLGGHLVTGHVDCVGVIKRLQSLGASIRIYVAVPAEHLRFLVEKGSVALDGISLTVNRVDAGGFELNLIPHTIAATTLKLAKEGDSVNIETDLIGKYVARLLNPAESSSGAQTGLSREDLARMGF
ncbi:MAG: riboflavin synthase [Desulfarculaceae bacterium]|jgi:riboflavin synthase